MADSVAKNYVYTAGYQIVSLLVPLITTPYISRVLGAENIGIYSYTASIASYFSMFLLLGTSLYGTREIAYAQNDRKACSRIFFEIQLFKIITSLLAILCYIIFLNTDVYDSECKYFLILQGGILLASFLDITWLFQGLEKFKLVVIRNFFIKVISVIAIFIFVKTENDLDTFIIVNVLGNIIGNAIIWYYLFDFIVRIPLCNIKIFYGIKTIFEMFIPVIAIQVYTVLDKIMLGNTGFMSSGGCYEQTVKIIGVCIAVLTSAGTVLMPRISVEFSEGNMNEISRIIIKSYKVILCFACAITFGIAAVSDNLVIWFLGSGFYEVGDLLKIYSIVLLMIPISNIAGSGLLNPMKMHNKCTIAVIIGAIVNLPINLVLIPELYAMGATIGTVIAEIAVTLCFMYYVRNIINLSVVVKFLLKYSCVAMIMGIIVWYTGELLMLNNYNAMFITAIQIIEGLIIYCVLLAIIRDDVLKEYLEKILLYIKL